MFDPVRGKPDFPANELAILAFWREAGIYRKSLEQRAGAERFVFFEGPPTANGMPHPGHCLTRTIKDLYPRYQTMRGRLCERKGGWDTHGLPVEVEVCKALGIHSKAQIEEYGVEPVVLQSAGRLIGFFRGESRVRRGRQYVGVSDDRGTTWKTELSVLDAEDNTKARLAAPCAVENPNRPGEILVLTTESDDEKKLRARRAGATGWIVKPFDPAKLIAAVRRVAA
jgi:hypothetical protein